MKELRITKMRIMIICLFTGKRFFEPSFGGKGGRFFKTSPSERIHPGGLWREGRLI